MSPDPGRADDRSFTAVIEPGLIEQGLIEPGLSGRGPLASGEPGAMGLRLAVKDIIDMAGWTTTLGSRVIAQHADPAERDAACLAHWADEGAIIVGRTNLHELAFGASGINSSMGTPVNPLGAGLIPGGSSSGNATALRSGQCDIAFGTDTGGSVRIPAACCGVLGLKTTAGLVPTEGVHPLAPTLDTVGPMAATPALLRRGWDALIGRSRPGGEGAPDARSIRLVELDGIAPAVSAALHATARAIGADVAPSTLSPAEWDDAGRAAGRIIVAEAAASNAHLRTLWPDLQSAAALEQGLRMAEDVAALAQALEHRRRWIERMHAETASSFLLLPTIECPTPTIRDVAAGGARLTRLTSPINLCGFPAISVPVTAGAIPISVQLVGPPHSEDALIDLAERVFVAAGPAGAPG